MNQLELSLSTELEGDFVHISNLLSMSIAH